MNYTALSDIFLKITNYEIEGKTSVFLFRLSGKVLRTVSLLWEPLSVQFDNLFWFLAARTALMFDPKYQVEESLVVPVF